MGQDIAYVAQIFEQKLVSNRDNDYQTAHANSRCAVLMSKIAALI